MSPASEHPFTTIGTTQSGLFGGEDMAIDPTFAAAHRIELDAASWVEHIPGWLTCAEPRRTAEYTDLGGAPEPLLRAAAAVLSRRYGVPYDGLWLNSYRDHRDSTGWHGDWPTCKRAGCIGPVLSSAQPADSS